MAPLKMLASAITIGSGGAARREGPTALISAGVGSIYGTVTKRSGKVADLFNKIPLPPHIKPAMDIPINAKVYRKQAAT